MEMKIRALICFIAVFAVCAFAGAHQEDLLIDDFETPVSGGPDGTVDFGAGNGSSIEVAASSDIRYSGNQSLKLTYDAVSGGYMWAARGFDLDAKNAAWLLNPEDIDWNEYDALSFYMYGADSKTWIAFDIKDSGNEMWRLMIEDNFKGWKRIICPFGEFYSRGDWQPDNADVNAQLDFPIKSFQFEPRPEIKNTLYFDYVQLIKQGRN